MIQAERLFGRSEVGAGRPFEVLAVLRQKMEQNFENETEYVSMSAVYKEYIEYTDHGPLVNSTYSTYPENISAQPITFGKTPRKHLTSWRKLHYLSEFVKTILGLSPEEAAILDAVRGFQMPKTPLSWQRLQE